ncbi:MAG: RpiB/LacA/LacB family sugar-phosphate isomerase [Planctomycetia bacterium]|jgi:ribose 5-phosphate isomerase B
MSSSDQNQLAALVRRVVGRVMGDQGRADAPSARPAGVHVAVEQPRPAEDRAEMARVRGSEIVTVDDLARIERGGELVVRPGAVVTPLAADAARERGIRLVERATVKDSGRLRVAVGADHGGFRTKAVVLEELRRLGHVGFDLGTRDENAVDYPDYAAAVGEAVASGQADLGIALDGAGIGSAIAANKLAGIRAATCWDAQSAANAREHNHANVLCLGAKMLPEAKLLDAVRTFLATAPGGDRHAKRVAKITALDQRRR